MDGWLEVCDCLLGEVLEVLCVYCCGIVSVVDDVVVLCVSGIYLLDDSGVVLVLLE